MAAVPFTPEQQAAIHTIDKSVLVSAAAGSGKTAVLVERIVHIICSGAADVDRMLVVTFTNAAAAEMKRKLTKALRQAIDAAAGQDAERLARLRRQQSRLYRAYISTFHSFAIRIIKEFFYLIDLEPSFTIGDEPTTALLQMEAMEELFEEGFAEDAFIAGGSFRDFLDHYSRDRSEDALMQELLAAYHKLRSMPEYFHWAESAVERLRLPEEGYRETAVYRQLLETLQRELGEAAAAANALQQRLQKADLVNTAEKLSPEIAAFEEMLEQLRVPGAEDKALETLSAFDFPRFGAGKGEKEAYTEQGEEIKQRRDAYKKRIQDFRASYLQPDLETRFREQAESYPYTRYALALLERFEALYEGKKQERKLLDFEDTQHIAARILTHPEAADTLRDRFDYIFIDEYQDTNRLQEHLISRVARPNNVFRVGDIKQSIYRFRQSEPQLFLDARRYCSDPANASAETIDLNRNFRSNPRTIAYINAVFESIMPGYDRRERLYPGLPCAPEDDLEPECHVLLEQAEVSRVESEAAYVAELVEQQIGTMFYDVKQGVRRPAEARDIVILLRATTRRAEDYHKALRSRGIQAHVSDEDGYFDTVEIGVAMALLRVIDNQRDDVSLLAVLHSEIFGFSPADLAEVRASVIEQESEGARMAYCDALRSYAEQAEGELAAALRSALARIDAWRTRAGRMPLDDYLWFLLNDSGYYLYAGAMYGGRQRQANLRTLVERAGIFRRAEIASLGSFIRYLDILRVRRVKTEQALMLSEEDDVVRIMSIHKSKGLEFPFVIVAGLGNSFNTDKFGKGLVIDPDLGLSLAYVNREQHYWRSTLLQRLIQDKNKEEAFQEELRVLYVAMTRARAKLLLVATVKSEDALSGPAARGSYLEVMREVLPGKNARLCLRQAPVPESTWLPSAAERLLGQEDSLRSARKLPEYPEVARRLSYRYPHREALTAKAKYAVTELCRAQRGEDAESRLSGAKSAAAAASGVSAAELGTAYHRIMEFLRFERVLDAEGRADRDYVARCVEQLHANGAIGDAVYARLDLGQITPFFTSDIGRRAAQAAAEGRLCKETPFTLRTAYQGRAVLVQGMIDAYFEEADGLVLIDYKSGHQADRAADRERYMRENYALQMAYYRRALEAGSGQRVKAGYLYLFAAGSFLSLPEDAPDSVRPD